MPLGQPRKSRKRTREIRAQSRATGARYTEAMRANDRTQAGGPQLPPRLASTRTLLLPLVQDALAGLYELDGLLLRLRMDMVLDHEGVLVGYQHSEGVPIPGAPIEDVFEAYWQVRSALPEGTEQLVDGTEEYPPNMLLLVGPDGGKVVHLAAIEVAEADLALLSEFADALDRAAGPRPGPEFEGLKEALGALGRKPYYSWMPEGDEATVARWVRQSLSPVLHSPFEGPRGTDDHETLSGVLRYAESLGWDSVRVDQDEEEAAERVMWNMVRAALAI
ncbi:hypothetical protein ACIHEJ_38775 [Streptomyces sp. NPDC052301]|uniref:hypothetical protein n=1 Tax=Streptomyces sp. NPDC052301 TaxID=3365687 RepID=UPI0037CCFA3B